MAFQLLSESLVTEILRRDLGGDWQLSSAVGTLQTPRLARQGDRSLAIKLTTTAPATLPLESLRRLAADLVPTMSTGHAPV